MAFNFDIFWFSLESIMVEKYMSYLLMDVIILTVSGFVHFAEFENIKASGYAFVSMTISTLSSS